MSKGQLELALARRAQVDPAFATQLRDRPREAVAGAVGAELPADLTVHVRHDTATDLHLVLPVVPPLVPVGDDRVRDTDLSGLSGGAGDPRPCQLMPYVTAGPRS